MIRILSSVILVFILFSASFSQENFIVKKIGFIDRYALEDNETGIKAITNAYEDLYIEECFSPIQQILYHLKKPDLSPEERNKKEILLKDLVEESKKIRENREKIVLEPIYKKVFEFINIIEKNNNFTILFADELYLNKSLLFVEKDLDFSDSFIKAFDTPNIRVESIKVNIPDSRIALMNTERFYDTDSGLKQLLLEFKKIEPITNRINETLTDSEKIRRNDYSKFISNIGQEIVEFSKNKGFNIVFDSSKKLPQQLQNVDSKDITEEFIQYFNNKYPKIEEK